MEADNVNKLAQIEALIGELGILYCIGGDWNMPPEQIEATAWIKRVMGKTIVPEGVTGTCSNGGRMLDYVVASAQLANVVRVVLLPGAPWSTHLATMLVIPRAPRSVHVRTLAKPRSVPTSRAGGQVISWECAKRTASAMKSKSEPTEEIANTPFIADRADDFARGVEGYQRWSLAAEIYLLADAGVPAERWSKHIGRGTWPTFHETPVANKIPRRTANLADPVARLFASIHGNLKMLQCLAAKGKGARQILDIVHYLNTMATNDLIKAARNQEKDEDKHDFFTVAVYLLEIDPFSDQGRKMEEAIELAAKLTARFRTRAAVARKNSFRLWCDEALQAGAAKAHGFLKEPDRPPQPAELVNDQRGIARDPNHSRELRSKVWGGWWNNMKTETRQREIQRALGKLLSKAKERIKTEPLDTIREEHITKALNALKKDRAKGTDQWAPGDWRKLPVQAKEEIAQQLNDAESKLALPMQILLNAVSLLGKSHTDDRPTAVTALLYAVYSAFRTCYTIEWDIGHAAFWDSAIKGSSPLRAAILRRLTAELAMDAHQDMVETYLDIKKFYDMIDVVILIDQAMELDFKPIVMYMSLQVHMAPRVLRAHGVYGQVISISNSILQGCANSNSFARVTLYNVLQEAHSRIPAAVLGQHVDDVLHRTVGSEGRVVEDSVELSILFEGRLADQGLQLADQKCVVTASKRKLAEAVTRRLKMRGLNFQTANAAKDLGVDAGTGNKRSTVVADGRFRKAKRRAVRAGVINKCAKKKTGRLWKTNVLPAAIYGTTAFGVPPTKVRKLRTISAAAIGCDFKGGCTTTALHLHELVSHDPAVYCRTEQLEQWFKFLHLVDDNTIDRVQMVKSWMKARTKLKGGGRWSMVHGPLAATIATLYDIGWVPATAKRWMQPRARISGGQCDREKHEANDDDNVSDEHGEQYDSNDINSGQHHSIDGGQVPDYLIYRMDADDEVEHFTEWQYHGGCVEQVVDAVTGDICQDLLRQAAKHFEGGGAQRGIDWVSIRNHLSFYRNRGMRGHEAMLTKIACGAMWNTSQLKESGQQIAERCTLCGGPRDHTYHRAYCCTALPEDAEWNKDLEEIRERVSNEVDEYPIFWLRGLVPA